MIHTILLYLFAACLLLNAESALAVSGQGAITGKVTDKNTREPLPGVNVIIDGTKLGTATNKSGTFFIKEIPVGEYKIFFSMIGYARLTLNKVLVFADSVIQYDVSLTEESVSGEEVVIISDRSTGDGSKGKAKSSDDDKMNKDNKDKIYDGEKNETTTTVTGGTTSGKTKNLSASGLKAGFADDNKQFNYFVNFLELYSGKVKHYPADIQERIVFRIHDLNGKAVHNAAVTIKSGRDVITGGKTYADGTFMFFPSMHKAQSKDYEADISSGTFREQVKFKRDDRREITVQLNMQRTIPANVPLDIVFIIDATGSMGEEIRQLRNSIELINLNIAALSTKPAVRFGLVAYRDRGDDYITKVVKLTDDIDHFQSKLNQIEAGGGGDEPEDLQSALKDAIQGMDWTENGVRMCFIITDAPPQLYKDQNDNYISTALEAKEKAIKIFSLGCGGLDLQGEVVLRQIAQLTYGKYIFLTYGEKGESEGGKTGSVSHHTGSNYETDKLEALLIRFIKDELQHLTDRPVEVADDYFEAIKNDDEKSDETVQKLMAMALTQLADYSTARIADQTSTAVISIVQADSAMNLKTDTDYFTQNLIMALSRNKLFQLVERQQIENVLKEQDLQLTDLVDENTCVKVGLLAGAKLLFMGTLFNKEKQYEIFLKLIKVETAEILSVTKLRIDKRLGVMAKK